MSPAMPSGFRPLARWNSVTTLRVSGPKMPSGSRVPSLVDRGMAKPSSTSASCRACTPWPVAPWAKGGLFWLARTSCAMLVKRAAVSAMAGLGSLLKIATT